MAKSVEELIVRKPITVNAFDSAATAAKAMRDNDIGAVIVVQGDKAAGILTDRDIVVRAAAEGHDLGRVPAGEICTRRVQTLEPRDTLKRAVDLMRTGVVRRLPVLDEGRPVGMVTLGDLARELDRTSVLGTISSEPPNR